MSRYGGDPRSSAPNVAYRDSPPRWDADRFTREREIRYNGPVPEREREHERPYEDYGRRMEDRFATPPRQEPEQPRFEEKFMAEERYGPPGRRVERKFYEEEDVYGRGPPSGALVPFRRPEVPPPPRPGIIRRQSSLDTFNRQPTRRFEEYDREEYRGPPPSRFREPEPPRAPRYPEPRIPEPRYAEPRYAEPRYAEREYDDRDYKYKEREWVSLRHRDESPPSSHGGESARGGESVREVEREEEVVEEFGEVEKPFPRRGKTRMPRRLINLSVLDDLGYPFHQEGEIIVIEKALGKENIDEVVGLSKRYVERETTTVHLIEAPPPEIREERVVEKFEERVATLNFSEAPRSVREWDHLSIRSPSPSRTEAKSLRSHRSRATSRRSRSRRGSSPEKPEKIIDVHSDVITVREISPARTAKSGKSRKSHKSHKPRRRSPSTSSESSSSGSERTRIIERREIIATEEDESNSVHVGPLALMVSPSRERRKSRSDRDIKSQIRELEEERRALERERKDRDVIKVRKGTIVRDVDEDAVEVKKDKKAPTAGMMRAMLATLT